MTDRKVFADSVTPLPDQPGLTPHGLMIHAQKPTDRNEKMTLLFSVGISATAQADLEARVAKGEIIPPEELRESYRSDQNDLNALVSWLKKQGYKIVQGDLRRHRGLHRGQHRYDREEPRREHGPRHQGRFDVHGCAKCTQPALGCRQQRKRHHRAAAFSTGAQAQQDMCPQKR
jgi:hypothetical protein